MVDLEQLYSSLLERLGADGHLEVLTSQTYKRAVRRGEPLGELKPVKAVWIRSYVGGSTSVKQAHRYGSLTEALMSVGVWLDQDDKRIGVKPPPPPAKLVEMSAAATDLSVPESAPAPAPLPPAKPKFGLGDLVSKKKK